MLNFRQYPQLTKIVIPDDVTLESMNFSSKFQGMVNLIEVNFNQKNVINISRAYQNCSNLGGSPVCGDNVTNMYYAYYNCVSLTGSPVCGDKVTNMWWTYCRCSNLTGSPVCGNNVTGSMVGTYCNCSNLTGSPVCGEKVTGMEHAYENCKNLTGSPVCGDKVTDMSTTYAGCTNLTGSPVCGSNVTTMYCTYSGCTSLTGSPVCGDKVTDMWYTYKNCTNLTGSPVCGDNVTHLMGTYSNCTNLTGSPACGNNVTRMDDAYSGCSRLTGSPVCGDKVTNMSGAYKNCTNLTGYPICGENVTSVSQAYYNCPNLSGNGFFLSSNISGVVNCFGLRNTQKRFNLYVPLNSNTLTACLSNSSFSLVGNNCYWTNDTTNKCHYNTQYNIYIYPVANVQDMYSFFQSNDYIRLIDDVEDKNMYLNTTQKCAVSYMLKDSSILPQVTITSSSEDIVSVSNITIKSNQVDFMLNAHNIESTATITLNITQSSDTKTCTFVVTTLEEPYQIENTGTDYGFVLNESGYYQSANAGIPSSCAMCKVHVVGDGVKKLYFDCINHAGSEKEYDYGVISNLDTTLQTSDYWSEDDASTVFHTFKNFSSKEVVTLDFGVIPEGEHFVCIKYYKDRQVDSGLDSLQFKVRFE